MGFASPHAPPPPGGVAAGVCGLTLSLASKLAPLSNSTLTQSRLPHMAASMRAVLPSCEAPHAPKLRDACSSAAVNPPRLALFCSRGTTVSAVTSWVAGQRHSHGPVRAAAQADLLLGLNVGAAAQQQADRVRVPVSGRQQQCCLVHLRGCASTTRAFPLRGQSRSDTGNAPAHAQQAGERPLGMAPRRALVPLAARSVCADPAWPEARRPSDGARALTTSVASTFAPWPRSKATASGRPTPAAKVRAVSRSCDTPSAASPALVSGDRFTAVSSSASVFTPAAAPAASQVGRSQEQESVISWPAQRGSALCH